MRAFPSGLILLSVCAAAPGLAAETVSRSVTLHDVPAVIATPADAATVYRRILGAARVACGTVDIRELRALAEYDRCVARAVDDAVSRVRSPALAAVRARDRLAGS